MPTCLVCLKDGMSGSCDHARTRDNFTFILQGLLGAHDVTRVLQSLLTASWHKLHGGSWSPDHHPADEKVLKFVSPKQRKAAAHDALYR